jgi:hypothetical protein
MQVRIDTKEAELTADHKPKTALERILVTEIARATVQTSVCQEQLSLDHERVKEKGDSEWDADRRREVNTLAARLGKNPRRVVDDLEETLHGAEWCLDHWRGLRALIKQNGGLTEPQRQLCCDLMGLSPLLRDNYEQVPACDDKEGLLALVARQIQRLETQVTLVLRERDNAARDEAQRGLPMPPDPTTKRIKSNESRASKRLAWSIQTFNDVRAGIAPATIIDPETRKPLQDAPPPRPSPAPAPSPAAAAPSAPDVPADKPTAPTAGDDPVSLRDGLSADDQAMLQFVGPMLRSVLQAGAVKLPPFPGGSPDARQTAQS